MVIGHVPDLAAALCQAQAEFPAIPKTKTVRTRQYEYSYAPLDVILAAVRPILGRHGIAIMQSISAESITTSLIHTSGQHLTSDAAPVRPQMEGAQAFGGAVTYAKRYSLCAMLGIAPEDDTDVGEPPGKREHELDPGLKAAAERLRACGSMSALATAWNALTQQQRNLLADVKDQCKQAIAEADAQ